MTNRVLHLGKTPVGGGGWTPASVTTAFWWDCTDVATITKDGSNVVTVIADKSGNARSLIIPIGVEVNPVFTTNVLNSLSGCYFGNPTKAPGTAANMAAAAFSVSQPFMVFSVTKTASSDLVAFALVLSDAGGPAYQALRHTSFGDHAILYAGSVLDSGVTVYDVHNHANYIASVFDGASSKININGTTVTGDAGSTGFTSVEVSDGDAGVLAPDMYVLEIFCIPGNSSTDYGNAVSYIQGKYGL